MESLKVIKELLLELREGDEVSLVQAVKVVKNAVSTPRVSQEYIEQAFRHIATNLEEYEYVKHKGNPSLSNPGSKAFL